MSKHMAPVADEMFGCHIFVINLTLGGLNGYVSGTLISTWNVPPSYGVSGGPAIVPCNSEKLSFTRSILIEHLATCQKQMRMSRYYFEVFKAFNHWYK